MGGLGVKVQHFPLTLLVVLTTLTLPCERDISKHDTDYAHSATNSLGPLFRRDYRELILRELYVYIQNLDLQIAAQ